jgi:hypothetical protein
MVAPETVSMSALCAARVSLMRTGTAAVVCGWFGCFSIRTEEIFEPANVTSTWTSPFSVVTVVPLTTVEDVPEEPEEDVDGVVAGVEASEEVTPSDGS